MPVIIFIQNFTISFNSDHFHLLILGGEVVERDHVRDTHTHARAIGKNSLDDASARRRDV
jgi:hypothetical protein